MFIKILTSATVFLFSATSLAQAFDCNQPRPEMAGFHNMILFGSPDDKLYTYHLPLFSGQVNGESGHVLMHVYQGLWSVKLDDPTQAAYQQKFSDMQTSEDLFPFFSLSPRGNRFKVPEMICDPNISTDAIVVYGHVENNPQFPTPQVLTNHLSSIEVEKTVFAQRFDGSSKDKLTYVLFGTPLQYYLVHYLTSDENSFDQIVAIDRLDERLEQQISDSTMITVTVSLEENDNLVEVHNHQSNLKPNNKWKLPNSSGDVVRIEATVDGSHFTSPIEILEEVYFNDNSDLAIE